MICAGGGYFNTLEKAVEKAIASSTAFLPCIKDILFPFTG